ncbi:MAG TPA: putative porin [Vicinamibacteria bacterium]|nr:putative porin [Vicinamibacteria bacterium]
MLRLLQVLVLVAATTAPARAQDTAPVYQTQKASTAFKLDALSRQEWTDEVTFTPMSRRLFRARPRVELTTSWLQLGVGGDFNYGSDRNLEPPEGTATLPLLRDNYKSRDARLDLAWARLDPATELSVQGGRFVMPVRFTEMIWDRDLRPQGGSATIDFGSFAGLQRLAVTGVYSRGSHILPEDGAFDLSDRDAVWIASATAVFGAGGADRFELTGAFLKFDGLEFVDPRLRRQNTRVGGALVLPYEIVDVVARYRSEGRVHTTFVADYCWNTATSADNRGLWLALVLGSTVTARGSLEYVYASVDKDATLAAYATDDFVWQTGWAGHRLDLGIRLGEHTSTHFVGQVQRFKDSPREAEREDWLKRGRIELRVTY